MADGAAVHGRLPPVVVELHVFVPGATACGRRRCRRTTASRRPAGFLRTTFTLQRSGDEVTLRAESVGDGYPEHARERFELVVHGDVDVEFEGG